MTPLVFKQHVPNVSENTLGASGLAEARISRESPKFKDLVVNYNPDIFFKDEEGTGADRVMTQRCKDKLNTLAISAMNQWPGVKLRVTEAWDEDIGQHAKDSLHYEGRAVDITTSDRDRSKYGMLARLAVEAGFDWVYYESRGHIHCSVKSDSSIAVKNGGCFPGESTLRMEDGRRLPLSEISIGDKVLVLNPEGQLVYDDVILFLHRDENSLADYVVLETDLGKSFASTANHLVYVTTDRNIPITLARAEFARDVTPSHYLYIRGADDTVVTTKVTAVRYHKAFGAYAPLTKHGTVVVDDVVASCYAVIRQLDIAHAALAPVRWYYTVKQYISNISAQPEHARNLSHVTESQARPSGGVHWYVEVLHNIGLRVIPASLWYES